MIRPSEVHEYDLAEQMFLRGEPLQEVHHGCNCECDMCLDCESHEYQYVYQGGSEELARRMIVACVVVSVTAMITLLVAVVSR